MGSSCGDSDGESYDYMDTDNAEADSSSEDYAFDTGAEVETTARKHPYVILTKADIERKRAEAIQNVIGILDISEDEASKVLRKYKWDANRVNEEWFSDMDAVRKAVGLMREEKRSAPATSGRDKKTCQICFDTFPAREMCSAPCRHMYCKECYHGFVTEAIGQGLAKTLDLRCPTPKCGASVPIGVIRSLCSETERSKLDTYLVRSFVEDNRAMAWCTGAACENAVECQADIAPGDPMDVICTCGATFCFNCKEEAHRPLDCDTVRKWIVKNSAESENTNWILANTKPCPKCHRPIEKNQGCMHMTCSQCRHEFCWLCNGCWKEHGERTGGFYACNKFETSKKKGIYDEETARRENAKQSLERYMHYFERYDAHHKAREKAKLDAIVTQETTLELLSDRTKTPTSQLKFIPDAWKQVIETRRMLKWTYAYGYYKFQDAGRDPVIERQKTFFEFLQSNAERSLEQLHEMTEKELRKIMDDGGAEPDDPAVPISAEVFADYRKRLTGLTDVTHSFFIKLIKQLEQGFDDMDQIYAGYEIRTSPEPPQPTAAADHGAGPSTSAAAGPSRSNASRAKAAAAATDEATAPVRRSKRVRGLTAPATGGSPRAAASSRAAPGTDAGEQEYWVCATCTLHNHDLDAESCEACGLPRDE